jgi:hypothetical protein
MCRPGGDQSVLVGPADFRGRLALVEIRGELRSARKVAESLLVFAPAAGRPLVDAPSPTLPRTVIGS